MKTVITILSLVLFIFVCADRVEAKGFKPDYDTEFAITDFSDPGIQTSIGIVVEGFAEYADLEAAKDIDGEPPGGMTRVGEYHRYNWSDLNLSKRTKKFKVHIRAPV